MSMKIGVISGCDELIELNRLNSQLKSLSRHHQIVNNFDLIDLSQQSDDHCQEDIQFSIIFDSITNNEFQTIIASIDNKYCELTRLLTVVYKKYVLTWNCEALLSTDSDYSPYFVRIGKIYQNGIILLSELLFQFKWKSIAMFVMSNNTVINDHTSAQTFISGIKMFLGEYNIKMREAFVIDDTPFNHVLNNISKIVSNNIKCKYM